MFDRLHILLSKRQAVMNQPIHITDIFVYPTYKDYSYGESKNFCMSNYANISDFERLMDHIETLIKIANLYHQHLYCEQQTDGSYAIKANCVNKNTRLSTPEFFFYLDGPLCFTMLDELIRKIEAIAKAQHENVHLVLSSFPIITDSKKILNHTLRIQCGKDGKVESICKAMAWKFDNGKSGNGDIEYPGTENFSQEELEKDNNRKISEFIATTSGLIINNRSLSAITTQGGAVYWEGKDICRDYFYGHSKSQLRDFFQTPSYTSMVPQQFDHLLLSNSISQKPELKPSNLTNFVAHIDPQFTPVRSTPLQTPVFAVSDLEKIANKDKYFALKIVQTSEGYLIKYPAFGYHYMVSPQVERKLDTLIGFDEKINERNAEVENNFFRVFLRPIIQFENALAKLMVKQYYLKGPYKNLYADLRAKLKCDLNKEGKAKETILALKDKMPISYEEFSTLLSQYPLNLADFSGTYKYLQAIESSLKESALQPSNSWFKKFATND